MSGITGLVDAYFDVKGGFFFIPRLITLEILFWFSIAMFVTLAGLSKIPFFGKVYNKFLLYVDGFIGMIASQDPKWIQPRDWSQSGITKEATKRIVFIRHGESVWNECVNKGVRPKVLLTIIKRAITELTLYPSPYSLFLDTPLNTVGLQQAVELQQFLADASPISIVDPALRDVIACLRGDSPEDSLIVSSQLRRALSTAAIALKPRTERTNEKILIHSACQEISRNVDCVAMSEPGTIPCMEGPDCGNAGELMKKANSENDKYIPTDIFLPALNGGNKPLNEHGVDRILNFADWTFTRPEHTIIIGGHSLWFRNFFRAFLPSDSKHPGKNYKMENGACVVFTLNVGQGPGGNPVHWIDQNTIVPVFKGFSVPKNKKKE